MMQQTDTGPEKLDVTAETVPEPVVEVPTSPRSTNPDLPEDVVEQIVNELSNSLPSLKACSLVSRVWRSIARPSLHSRYTFNATTKDVDRLSGYADTPRLIDNVQTLVLNYPSQWSGRPNIGSILTDFEARLQRLDALPKVKSLVLSHVNFVNAERQGLYSFITKMLPGVRSLTIDSESTFTGVDHLSSLIHSFPLLRSLDLGALDYLKSTSVTGGWDSAETRAEMSGLRSLRLFRSQKFRKAEISKMLGIIPGSTHAIALDTLSIHWPRSSWARSEDNIEVDLCNLFGPSLRHLELKLGSRGAEKQEILRECVNLETLYVEASCQSLSHVGIFKQISSPRFRQLTLLPRFKRARSIASHLMLSNLDNELKEGRIRVEKILLLLPIGHRMSTSLRSILDEVNSGMPWSRERGILDFEYVFD